MRQRRRPTRRSKAEQVLRGSGKKQRELVEEIERAHQAKSDFIADMSHELRTPLALIIGYNDMLRDEVFGPVTADQAKTLERIGEQARELLNLVSTPRLDCRLVGQPLRVETQAAKGHRHRDRRG